MFFSPQKWVAVLKHGVGLAALIAVAGCQSGTSTFTWKTPDLQAWKFWDRQKPAETQVASQAPMVNHQLALPSQTATPTTMTAPQYPTTGTSPYAATAPGVGTYPTTGYGQPGYGQPGYGQTGYPATAASPYAAPTTTVGTTGSAAYPGAYAGMPNGQPAANAAPVQSGYYNPNYPQATPAYGGNASSGVSTASAATSNGAMATGYTAPTSGYGHAGTAPQQNAAPAAPAYAAPAAGSSYGPAGYPQTADARNRVGSAGASSASSGGGYATGSPYDPATNYPSTSGDSRYGTTAPAVDGAASQTGPASQSAVGDRYSNVPAAGGAAPSYSQGGSYSQQSGSGSRYGAGPRYEGGPDRYSAGLDRSYPTTSNATAPAVQTPSAGSYRPGGTGDYIPPGTNQLNSNEHGDHPHDGHAHGNGPVAPASYRPGESSTTAPAADSGQTQPAVFTPPAAGGTS